MIEIDETVETAECPECENESAKWVGNYTSKDGIGCLFTCDCGYHFQVETRICSIHKTPFYDEGCFLCKAMETHFEVNHE